MNDSTNIRVTTSARKERVAYQGCFFSLLGIVLIFLVLLYRILT